jgi:small subunit ribosomal protein S21
LAHVVRKPGERIEGLLKRFRRGLQQGGQLREYRRKRFFVSKGEARRDKRRRAERRRRRRELRRKEREERRRR